MSVEKLKSDIEKMITNAGLDLASVAATTPCWSDHSLDGSGAAD